MLGLCYKRFQLVLARSCDPVNHFDCFQKGPLFWSSFSSKSLGRAQTDDKDYSFTVSYLKNSFGFSPELALSISKKKRRGRFKSPENPDSVVKLLKDYGLSDNHISEIAKKCLVLFSLDAEKTLLPKLEFLSSIGISGTALARMLCTVPTVLASSLERSLKPCYDISTTLRIPNHKLPYFFTVYQMVLTPEKLSNVVRNVSVLQANDVPASSFPLWVAHYAKALSFDSEKVKENVKKVISMGFSPSSPKFMKALYVISVTDASKWEQKIEFYKKWGWTEDDILLAFRKSPLFIGFKEKNISKKMDFYLNKMGYQPADVARCPDALTHSLEKRIIPWCSVIKILSLKGLLRKENCSLYYILKRNPEFFLERFVINYQEQVPELFSIFQGKMTIAELGLEFEETGV